MAFHSSVMKIVDGQKYANKITENELRMRNLERHRCKAFYTLFHPHRLCLILHNQMSQYYT